MIRLTWIFAALALAAATGHFGYLHLVAAPETSSVSPAERSELAWLQRELALTPAQLTAIRTLHEECWAQVAAQRTQLDRERRTARVSGSTAACVAVEDECKNCTALFIRRVSGLLNSVQQQRYLSLVAACLPPARPAPPTAGASAAPQGDPVEPAPGR